MPNGTKKKPTRFLDERQRIEREQNNDYGVARNVVLKYLTWSEHNLRKWSNISQSHQ